MFVYFTVSVTMLLVTLPAMLVTTHLYLYPLCRAAVVREYVADVPFTVTLFQVVSPGFW